VANITFPDFDLDAGVAASDLGGALNHPITVGCNDHPQILGFYYWVYHMIAESLPKWLLIAFISWKSLLNMSQSYGL
jgi:hypothetical protein